MNANRSSLQEHTEDGRWLIVNADDFGLSDGVNAGILAAHRCGTVTSTSLMVRWPAAAAACQEASGYPDLAMGLHLDLGEWTYRNGQWETVYQVVPPDDPAAVMGEVHAQLDAFRALVGRDPTHIDSHQHVHRQEPVRSIASRLGQELGVPVRGVTPEIHYCGDFYGQTGKGEPRHEALRVDAFIDLLINLPEGITELACHPGCDLELQTMYCRERLREVQVLCDPAVRAAIQTRGIRLISFAELRRTAALAGPAPAHGVERCG